MKNKKAIEGLWEAYQKVHGLEDEMSQKIYTHISEQIFQNSWNIIVKGNQNVWRNVELAHQRDRQPNELW